MTVVASLIGFSTPSLVRDFVFHVRSIRQRKESYRLLTSGLLHADPIHLAVNMFCFWSFAESVEVIHGPRLLLVIYLAAIIGGGLLSLVLHRDEPEFRALGASGGVSGVIFASLFLVEGGSIYIFPLPIPIPPTLFAFLFLAVSTWGMQTRAGNIGHDAHFGGAMIGMVTAAILRPGDVFDQPLLFTGVLAAALGGLAYVSYRR